MIAREGASARRRAIPFGPFLALGGLVGLLAGAPIVDWYLGTFS
jgi:leader peptidase (prepilin peptidase)/N-methyltransferase